MYHWADKMPDKAMAENLLKEIERIKANVKIKDTADSATKSKRTRKNLIVVRP